jgi:outer membrane protein assembly factor BamB
MLMLAVVTSVAVGCTTKSVPPPQTEALGARSFARQWATDLADGRANPITAIHLVDKFVFAYRQDGSSAVIDRTSGRLMQVDRPADGVNGLHAPVVLKDRIVYPTTTHLDVFEVGGRHIPHPLRPTDESDKPFSQDLKFPIRSDAVGTGKMVYFGADFRASGRAVAADMTRAYVPEIWTLMTPGSFVSAAPALSKDTVFIASEKGSVTAVTMEDRQPVWSLPEGVFGTYGGVVANLMLDSTGLYVASTDSKLYCLNEKLGKVKWQFFAGAALRTPPALTKDAVYQYIEGRGLAAIDKNPGPDANNASRSPRWLAPQARQFLAEDGSYVYIANAEKRILALDKATGEERFRSRRKDFSAFAASTAGDGLIYLADDNARVTAVHPILQAGSAGEVVMDASPVQSVALAK